MKQEDVDRFLEELTLLSRKYKIEIEGCGCCGSPYLKPLLKAKACAAVYSVGLAVGKGEKEKRWDLGM